MGRGQECPASQTVAPRQLCCYRPCNLRHPMQPRHPISIRPTAAQLAWLQQQRATRGIAMATLVILALEQAMLADQQAAAPSQAQQ
jgi:hypothetical protein